MNIAFAAPSISLSRVEKHETALWGAAGVAALVLHLVIILVFHAMRPSGVDIGTPAALMIELASLPSAVATESEALMSNEVPPDPAEPMENVEKTVEAEPIEEPVVEEVQQEKMAEAEPVEEPESLEEPIPDTVEVKTPEVAVPIPQPRPVIKEKPRPEKKQAKEVQQVPEPREKARLEAKLVETARLPVEPVPTAPANRNQSASMGQSGVTPASWQKQVQAWLKRHQRYPAEVRRKRQMGTVEVKFTIDASGHITSSSVTRSSGNPLLDKAALEMLERASPVPPPPRGYNTASLIRLPVEFVLR